MITHSYRIWFDPSEWNAEQREWIGLGVFAARELGVDLLWENHREAADVTLERWDSEDNYGALAAGDYTESLKRIRIDPVGCHGELEFRHAVSHEVGHFLGMGHLPAPAIMAERVGASPVEFSTHEAARFPVATVAFTRADIAEFQRVHS